MRNDTMWPVAKVDSASTMKFAIDDAIACLRAKGDQLPAPHCVLWEGYGTHFILTGFVRLIDDVVVFDKPLLMQSLLKYLKDPAVSNIGTGLGTNKQATTYAMAARKLLCGGGGGDWSAALAERY